MLLSTICLYLTLAACGLLIVVAVVKYDVYQREPWPMVIAAIALGAGTMWLAGLAQTGLIVLCTGRVVVTNLMLATMAGVTEEIGKLAVVVAIALFVRRHFDEPIDGVIYGSLAGLGAAIEESAWVLRNGVAPEYLPLQEPVRLAGHLIMGGIGGFGMGFLVMRARWWPAAVIGSLLSAIVLHTVWDIAAFSAADSFRFTGKLRAWHTIVPVLLMLLGMLAYRRMLHDGARLTRRHLQLCDLRTRECPPAPSPP